MSDKIKTINGLPNSVAMQRLMICTDGLFTAECDDNKVRPVYVERIGIRGANMPAKEKKGEDGKKGEGKDTGAVAPQTVETAKLPMNAVALNVDFGIKFIDMSHAITSCISSKNGKVNANEFRAAVNEFIDEAKGSSSINEVALRYAHRILSGSWLWRNLVIADSVKITATNNSGEVISIEDGFDFDPNVFAEYTDAHHKLADWIVAGLNGESKGFIKVNAKVEVGAGGFEVFPSQAFASEKTSSGHNVSKILYKKFIGKVGNSEAIVGQAALRDQKIGNAIRTIDNWYTGYEESGSLIAIEPFGASLSDDKFYRLKEESGARLLQEVEVLDMNSDNAKYLMALIIRGGVFTS